MPILLIFYTIITVALFLFGVNKASDLTGIRSVYLNYVILFYNFVIAFTPLFYLKKIYSEKSKKMWKTAFNFHVPLILFFPNVNLVISELRTSASIKAQFPQMPYVLYAFTAFVLAAFFLSARLSFRQLSRQDHSLIQNRSARMGTFIYSAFVLGLIFQILLLVSSSTTLAEQRNESIFFIGWVYPFLIPVYFLLTIAGLAIGAKKEDIDSVSKKLFFPIVILLLPLAAFAYVLNNNRYINNFTVAMSVLAVPLFQFAAAIFIRRLRGPGIQWKLDAAAFALVFISLESFSSHESVIFLFNHFSMPMAAILGYSLSDLVKQIFLQGRSFRFTRANASPLFVVVPAFLFLLALELAKGIYTRLYTVPGSVFDHLFIVFCVALAKLAYENRNFIKEFFRENSAEKKKNIVTLAKDPFQSAFYGLFLLTGVLSLLFSGTQKLDVMDANALEKLSKLTGEKEYSLSVTHIKRDPWKRPVAVFTIKGNVIPHKNVKPNDLLDFSRKLNAQIMTQTPYANPLAESGYVYLSDKNYKENFPALYFSRTDDTTKLISISTDFQHGSKYINEFYSDEFLAYIEQSEKLSGKEMVVLPGALNLRAKPDEKSDRIGSFQQGMILMPSYMLKQETTVGGKAGHWYFVEKGWVFGSQIVEVNSVKGKPEAYYYTDIFYVDSENILSSSKYMVNACETQKDNYSAHIQEIKETTYDLYSGAEAQHVNKLLNHNNRLIRPFLNGVPVWRDTNGNLIIGNVSSRDNKGNIISIDSLFSINILKEYNEPLYNHLKNVEKYDKVTAQSGNYTFYERIENIPEFKVYGRMSVNQPYCTQHYECYADCNDSENAPWIMMDNLSVNFEIHDIKFDAPAEAVSEINGKFWEARTYPLLLKQEQKAKEYCQSLKMRLPTSEEIAGAVQVKPALFKEGTEFWSEVSADNSSAAQQPPVNQPDKYKPVRCISDQK